MVSTNLWFLCGDVKFHTLWWSLLVLRELLKHCTQMSFPNHGLNVQRENSSSLPSLLVILLEVRKVHKTYIMRRPQNFEKISQLFLNLTSNKKLVDLFKFFWHKISKSWRCILHHTVTMSKSVFDWFILMKFIFALSFYRSQNVLCQSKMFCANTKTNFTECKPYFCLAQNVCDCHNM